MIFGSICNPILVPPVVIPSYILFTIHLLPSQRQFVFQNVAEDLLKFTENYFIWITIFGRYILEHSENVFSSHLEGRS